jgi:23S rRNA-/tRNA-specific pseudouridylate synthase
VVVSAPSPIPILFEDDHLMVVAKPSGLLVVPAPGRSGDTIADVLRKQTGHRIYPVHRLDEGVTGVLVVALTQAAKLALEGLFRQHTIQRVYLALLSRVRGGASVSRPLLHAESLRFVHPITGVDVNVTADAPEKELRR